MSKPSLRERQKDMAERSKLKRAKPPKVTLPKLRRWSQDHFTEVMERIIDDLGLDVPRREPKLTA